MDSLKSTIVTRSDIGTTTSCGARAGSAGASTGSGASRITVLPCTERWLETAATDPALITAAETGLDRGMLLRGASAVADVADKGCGAQLGDALFTRPAKPSLCTLPITALRVSPAPSAADIWLALLPSNQSWLSNSTLSSVQDIFRPRFLAPPRAHASLAAEPNLSYSGMIRRLARQRRTGARYAEHALV